jgi:hypothetical protein
MVHIWTTFCLLELLRDAVSNILVTILGKTFILQFSSFLRGILREVELSGWDTQFEKNSLWI